MKSITILKKGATILHDGIAAQTPEGRPVFIMPANLPTPQLALHPDGMILYSVPEQQFSPFVVELLGSKERMYIPLRAALHDRPDPPSSAIASSAIASSAITSSDTASSDTASSDTASSDTASSDTASSATMGAGGRAGGDSPRSELRKHGLDLSAEEAAGAPRASQSGSGESDTEALDERQTG